MVKKYRVSLAEEEQQELKGLVSRGRAAAYRQTHARILLLCDENQANRLWAHAGQNGIKLDQVVSEVASGLNDRRPELRWLLADPKVGMVDAMLQARGGGLLVIEDNEVDDDLVRDMTEMLTCFCARLYGRRSAANRARKAISIVQD